MKTSIREATSDDLPTLIELLYESDIFHWNALPGHFEIPGEPARTEDYVNHLLDEENGVILVAERGGQIIGLVQLAFFDERSGPYRRRHPHAAIGDVAVTAEHRRTGVGRLLMAAAHDWAQARGAAEIELTVWDFNEDATALYESLGYQTTRHTMRKLLE